MSEQGYCPNCGVDLDGGSIYEHFLKEYGDEQKALKTAKAYGADKDHGQWGRAIGLYDIHLDRTVAHKCPDCNHVWRIDGLKI